jgi:hypothetical protein
MIRGFGVILWIACVAASSSDPRSHANVLEKLEPFFQTPSPSGQDEIKLASAASAL